jgi:hypothetical protein
MRCCWCLGCSPPGRYYHHLLISAYCGFQYYNAEVTGVSERTCVVRFTEYGNYEEVLQDDCIPFTEVRYNMVHTCPVKVTVTLIVPFLCY